MKDFQYYLVSPACIPDRNAPHYAGWLRLPGHANLQTTMVYTHVARRNKLGVRSPLDGP